MPHYALSFHPNLVLRTPSRPFHSQFDEDFIRQCLSDNQFAEALYLASPALYEECRKWQGGTLSDPRRTEKLLHALVKYYARTSSRCTPFGLFAGCSVAAWGAGTHLQLARQPYRRHTRLDMQYLCALAGHLAARPAIAEKLRYFTNSSMYQIGDEIRYIEYHDEHGVRLYQISSAPASEYLLHVLAAGKAGLTVGELAGHLVHAEEDLTEADCRDFVHQLIAGQLLVSELEPLVTGKDFLGHLLGVLGRIGTEAPGDEATAVRDVLLDVAARLDAFNASVANDPVHYEQIAERLLALEVPLARNTLFQVDLAVLPDAPVLDRRWQDALREGLHVLNVLTPQRPNPHLEAFKTLFADRYGDQEAPLLDVLDAESGIGYPHQGPGVNTALTEDLVLHNTESEEPVIGQHEAQRYLYRKLLEAQKNGSYTVAIEPGEIAAFAPPDEQFAPSLSVLFRLTGSDTVLLEGVAGSSAVNLLGRFAHGNPAIRDVIGQLTQAEQRTNPGVVLAEISHLPQPRTGNILARPDFRDYEIPYLAHSTRPPEGQIPLRDLFVSLRNNRITLRSRRLNRVVVPRLGTAHNYSHQSLPVYHFLGDLQSQELRAGLHFSWDPVPPGVTFLPRVTYKNLVLHPATWQLSRHDLHDLLGGDAATLPGRLAAFRQAWQLPRLFTLADGDNELLVDAHNLLTVRAWLDTVKNYDTIRLREFLFDPAGSPVADAQGRPLVNQFVALLVNEKECYPDGKYTAAYTGPTERRKFWFGSEWLYYKFYCGVKSSDRILLEGVKPLTDELQARGLVDKWFFIRFLDPNPHLRVRFRLTDVARIGEVLLLVNQYLEPYQEKELVWKSQVDTYVRELERYGYQATGLSETLFCHDSAAAIAILEHTPGGEQEQLRWLWGVRSVDELLGAFGYGLPGKQRLIGLLKESFAREFGMNKDLKLQLDAKYRSNKAQLSRFLQPGGELSAAYPSIAGALARRNAYAATLTGQVGTPQQQQQLGVNPDNLVSSHVHMLLNRLIPANQRLHELVIYDFLSRQYQAQAAMRKQ